MTTTQYDNQNIFAKIIRGEMPSHKVYEDTHSLAFMDIMPRGSGHTLVIPINPARNIYDITPGDLAAVMDTVRKIACAQRQAFNADGTTIQQFSEPAGGQIVFHLHFHVIPRFEGIRLNAPHTDMADNDILARDAEKLRQVLRAE